MQEAYTPADARRTFYRLLKQVATEHKPVTIQQRDEKLDTVIVPKSDWDVIQETLYLAQTGTLDHVNRREKDDSSFTNVDDIDWNNLF